MDEMTEPLTGTVFEERIPSGMLMLKNEPGVAGGLNCRFGTSTGANLKIFVNHPSHRVLHSTASQVSRLKASSSVF